MRRSLILLLFPILFTSGCGPSAKDLRERTISLLNTEADRWDGGKDLATNVTDAYGRPVTSDVKKTTLNYILAIRSNGPDGLPMNSDDIVVSRSKRHGETSINEQAEKAAECVGRGAAIGVVKGIKKGLGFDRGEKKE